MAKKTAFKSVKKRHFIEGMEFRKKFSNKRLLIPLLFLLLLLPFALKKRVKGFSLEKISSSHPYNPKWDTRPLSAQEKELVDTILSQSFHYLGSGNHCYAFASEDDLYVIKFFKQKKITSFHWSQLLPISDALTHRWKALNDKRKLRREKEFTSYKIAFEELPKETSVIYLHLNKTPLHRPLTLFDSHGEKIILDSGLYEFLIQKKGELFYDAIHKMMKQGDYPAVKEAILSLVQLIETRSRMGIADDDLLFDKNFGIINGKCMEIDIGEFKYHEESKNPAIYQDLLKKIARELYYFLHHHYPECYHLFEDLINQLRERDH